MKNISKIIILVFITSFIVSNTNAQVLSDRSSISVSAGISLILNANINYEYRITDNSFISLGYGQIAGLFGDQIPHVDITHVFLKGRNNHYFEFGYGLTAIGSIDDSELLPNFRLGYRKINEYNSMFFRTGISVAEGLYVGFGRSF